MVAEGRFGTDYAGYADMLAVGRGFAGRVWAVEGCNGIGRHLAHRLIHDGEVVLDVPAKLSARVRVFATGNGRKTDAVDAYSVAMAALHSSGLHRLTVDPELVVPGLLADRRDELGRVPSQTVNRLHRLLLELLPGGAKRFLSAQQARALVASRRRTSNSETWSRHAARPCRSCTGSARRARPGCWPTSATSAGSRTGTGSPPPNGTAPLDASSGDQVRHRLSRAGNRRINRVLHIMAVVQLRNPTAGRAYYDARKAAGKTSMEAMRALKRRLSNVVYARMAADQRLRDVPQAVPAPS